MKIDAEEVARRAIVVHVLRSRIWALHCSEGSPSCAARVAETMLVGDELDPGDMCDRCKLRARLKHEAKLAQNRLTKAVRALRWQKLGKDAPEPWEQDR